MQFTEEFFKEILIHYYYFFSALCIILKRYPMKDQNYAMIKRN